MCLPVSSFCITGGPFGPLADVCALCCSCKLCSRKFGPIAGMQPRVAGSSLHAGNGRACCCGSPVDNLVVLRGLVGLLQVW